MAATPMPGNPNFDGNPPPLPPPPGTDMTGICFRDQLWLNTYPLDRNFVFDYFAMSPFYDRTCNNEQLRMNSIHPLDISHLSKMTGVEYMLNEVIEPNLFVIRKQKRDSPEKVTPMLTYYVLDGSIYQAPQLCNVFSARIGRALYYISKAFSTAASKLEKIGHDGETDDAYDDVAASKETIDIRELKRIDHIMNSVQRKVAYRNPSRVMECTTFQATIISFSLMLGELTHRISCIPATTPFTTSVSRGLCTASTHNGTRTRFRNPTRDRTAATSSC